MNLLKNLGSYAERHMKYIGIAFLAFLSLYLLFYHLGYYRLIDVDETRYVGISYAMLHNNDWTTPMLNGAPFLEKPPLYFWLNVISFKIFGFINEFSARFMTAFLALCTVWVNFFFSRKMLNTKYAVISSSILVTSLWFLLFSHVAILDFGFMFFTMSTIYAAILTLFCEKESNKKYLWWLAYALMALSVLMKGLIGIIIPAMVVFFVFLAFRKVKELFRPLYLFPGVLIFLLIALPWHIAVYNAQGQEWVNMYIIKHHFARFLNSGMGLGRKGPFLFYVPVILCGFLPWTFSFVSSLISGLKVIFKDIKSTKRLLSIFSIDTNDRKIILFSSIYFLSVFLFFSISSTKLPSYILTVIPAISLMCGYYWWGYLEYDKYKRGISVSAICLGSILLLGGIGAFVLSKCSPKLIGYDMIKPFLNSMIIWVVAIGILLIFFLIKNQKRLLFFTHCLFMVGIIYFATTVIIPFIMTFGQNELEEYSLYAKSKNSSTLITFDFQEKYSVMNKFDRKVEFITGTDFDRLKEIAIKAEGPVFVIVKNKRFDKYENEIPKQKIIKRGQKYSLLKL